MLEPLSMLQDPYYQAENVWAMIAHCRTEACCLGPHRNSNSPKPHVHFAHCAAPMVADFHPLVDRDGSPASL